MVQMTNPGAYGKANVGISNDKGREIRPRRKTKVLQNKKEFIITQIYYRRINMKNLFPINLRKKIEFSYHVIAKVNKEKFKPEKSKEVYLKKISYKQIFVHNKNEEEILFGYKFEQLLERLMEIKDNNEKLIGKEITKTTSLEFSKDLDILLKDDSFNSTLQHYLSKFRADKNDDQNTVAIFLQLSG